MKIINKNKKSCDGWNVSDLNIEIYDCIWLRTPNPKIYYKVSFDKLRGIQFTKYAGDGIFAPNDTPFESLEKYMYEE